MTELKLTAEQVKSIASGETVTIGDTVISLDWDPTYAPGARLIEFFEKKWPDGYYVEDDTVYDDEGNILLDPFKLYRIDDLGEIYGECEKSPMTVREAMKKWGFDARPR